MGRNQWRLELTLSHLKLKPLMGKETQDDGHLMTDKKLCNRRSLLSTGKVKDSILSGGWGVEMDQ